MPIFRVRPRERGYRPARRWTSTMFISAIPTKRTCKTAVYLGGAAAECPGVAAGGAGPECRRNWRNGSFPTGKKSRGRATQEPDASDKATVLTQAVEGVRFLMDRSSPSGPSACAPTGLWSGRNGMWESDVSAGGVCLGKAKGMRLRGQRGNALRFPNQIAVNRILTASVGPPWPVCRS